VFQSIDNATPLTYRLEPYVAYIRLLFSLLKVYESNSDRVEMASSIRGPCVVLPYDKFKQENDRRCQFGVEASASVQPIFLCRFVSLSIVF
jgi:hypothetical protein